MARCLSLYDALQAILDTNPTLIVTGANPRGFHPAELLQMLDEHERSSIPLVIVTTEPNHLPNLLAESMRSGVQRLLSLNMDSNTLECALRAVVCGLTVLGGEARSMASFTFQYLSPEGMNKHIKGKLTVREKEVLNLLTIGQSNREIADELGVGVRTVEMHIVHIASKLGVHSRTEIIIEALGAGSPGQL